MVQVLVGQPDTVIVSVVCVFESVYSAATDGSRALCDGCCDDVCGGADAPAHVAHSVCLIHFFARSAQLSTKVIIAVARVC